MTLKIFEKIRNLKYYLFPFKAAQDLSVLRKFKDDKKNPSNPLNKFGMRCFSQTDEDGITIEIVKRLKIKKGIFVEIGSGTGLQNNTLILSSMRWSGVWVDVEGPIVDVKKSKRLKFIKKFITKENIVDTINTGLSDYENKNIDLLSVDIDGNDFHVTEEILKKNIHPKVLVIEINQKFPPPVEFIANYDPKSKNSFGGDYHSASLTSYAKMLKIYGYTPICCTLIMGHNAFFIQDKYLDLFKDVPKELDKIYNTPSFWCFTDKFGVTKKETVEKILND